MFASRVKTRDANIAEVSSRGGGSACSLFVRGGGKYTNTLATAEGAGAQSVSLFGPEEKVMWGFTVFSFQQSSRRKRMFLDTP